MQKSRKLILALATVTTILTAGFTDINNSSNNIASASKLSTSYNKSASKEYVKESNKNVSGVIKLMGHKRKYQEYKFVLKKNINAYYMHYSNYGDAGNRITGKTTLKKGTVVYAYVAALSPAIMSTDGVVWHTFDNKRKLPKDFVLATVMTNKNAKISKGSYHTILKETKNAIS